MNMIRPLIFIGMLAGATDAVSCSARKNCHECAATNTSSSEDSPCFWCYDSGTCLDIQNPLSGRPLHGCVNLTFTEADCGCSHFTTCHECAKPKHAYQPACEWTNTTTNISFTLNMGGTSKTTSLEIASRVGCREGRAAGTLGPTPATRNATWRIPGTSDSVTLALVEKPVQWYWAQCKIAGPAPAAIAVGVAVLVLIMTCCIGVCICRRCCCKRRRRDPFEMATAPMINSQQTSSSSSWPPRRP